MLKINYPKASKEREVLENEYINSVCSTEVENKLKNFFKQKTIDVPNPPSLKLILLMPIEKLLSESIRIGKYIKTDHQRTKLKKILNYDKNENGYSPKKQPKIADFFSFNDDKIKLRTCYYCNIDFINAFANIRDYKSVIDFVNKAPKYELLCIKGINDRKAKELIKIRKIKKIINIDTIPNNILAVNAKLNLKRFVVKDKSNHFTLDHVLDKENFPLAALSLYNLVPSCYACNSKFKRQKSFIANKSKIHLSPTSVLNKFSTDFKFKILFSAEDISNGDLVTNMNDILLDFDFVSNSDDYELFLSVFKIHSRYVYHKSEALELIIKKKIYTNSRLREIAKIVNISQDKIKSDIFGKSLFEGAPENYPLTKLKRDVAKQIGVKGVK